MRGRVEVKKYKSFKSGIALLVMLIIVLMVSFGLQKSGLPSTLASLLNGDFENFRNLQQFDDEKATEAQKSLAGFWTYAHGDPETSPVAKREYLEILSNGIIWTVRIWTINTPSGERAVITHILTGYARPYSYSPDNSAYYCETRVIRQAFITDDVSGSSDTCYGGSHVDEIWLIGKAADGGSLNVDRRSYQPYTDDIQKFYPDLDLLDIPDKVTLKGCVAITGMPWIAKKILVGSIPAVPFFMRAAMVDSLARAYYKPIVIDELARRYDPRAVPEAMPIKITLLPNGNVHELKYKRAKIDTKRFDDLAYAEIKSWLFQPVGDSNEAQKIEMVIKVK